VGTGSAQEVIDLTRLRFTQIDPFGHDEAMDQTGVRDAGEGGNDDA